ncbi:MAG TPA: OsmC family peroxiredoxin [Burkholderiaceae bacterium]|jgi:lipoyl-dependent peroxiredoxin|nr:OsmC family peroxiredoxin [Burkholderiaceae bacterium]
MKRTGTAVWSGDLKGGSGRVATESGILDNVSYGYHSRYEHDAGTNPEELLGAAHAACFTMTLAGELAAAGMKARSLITTATVTLGKSGDDFQIGSVHLNLIAIIPGASQERFEQAALKAKLECPMSRLLNTHVTLDARLDH